MASKLYFSVVRDYGGDVSVVSLLLPNRREEVLAVKRSFKEHHGTFATEQEAQRVAEKVRKSKRA